MLFFCNLSMRFRHFQVALIAYLLLTFSLCPDWQASGNMTGYLEPIRGFIDDAIADNLDYTSIHRNLSARCNARWDRFWYVGVFWLVDPSTDGVVVGYAFRGHWFWRNNYGPNKQTFIVWKDYNCGTPGGMDGETEHNIPAGPNAHESNYFTNIRDWIDSMSL